MFDSLQSYGLSLLCPWDSPGKEYWSGLSFPLDLLDPGIEPTSLMSPALAGVFFTTSAAWEAFTMHYLFG